MKLSEDFFQEEILADTFVSRQLKEVWAVNLDLLDRFQRFCNQHQLNFFMGFGTLLGAFRHQGFVPWDDDVDILMPRPDFERLKRLWAEFEAPYFLQNSLSEPDFWYRGMMKFRRSDTTCLQLSSYQNRHTNQGIAIEIMALDRCPDIPAVQRQQAKQVGHCQRLLWAKWHSQDYHALMKDGGQSIPAMEWKSLQQEASGYTTAKLEQNYLSLCRQYEMELQGPLAIYISYNLQDSYLLFDSSWFDKTIQMEFAGLNLPAPADFWSCLERFYGRGFMGYVPKEHRRPHHPALWDPAVPYHVWQHRIMDIYPKSAEKQVILFGTGNMAQIFYQHNKQTVKIQACVDNDSRMWEKDFNGLPVYRPDYLRGIPADERHIIICNGYYQEIGRQLQAMGIEEYFVYVDDLQALFHAPGEGKPQADVWRKPYCMAGILLTEEELTVYTLERIHAARKESSYLIAFVHTRPMQQITAALREVDRAVYLESVTDSAILREQYHCEVIFDE